LRLLGGEIPQPPPGVEVDVSAGNPSDCKTERYSMSQDASCASCHQLMDPIGFGLERFDAMGRYREVEPAPSSCTIDAAGGVPGYGDFSGPRELGQIIADSGDFERCGVRQFYRFAVGRTERPEDESALVALEQALMEEGDFVGLLLAFVGSEAFLHRVVDPS